MELFTNIFTTRWTSDRLTHMKALMFYAYMYLCIFAPNVQCESEYKAQSKDVIVKSRITIEYNESTRNIIDNIKGRYGIQSEVNRESTVKGQLVHVQSKHNKSDYGCEVIDPSIIPPKVKWIALIKRGICEFNEKIYNAAKLSNASAVVIYNTNDSAQLFDNINIQTAGQRDVTNVITIFIKYEQGNSLVELLKSHKVVNMTIAVAPVEPPETTTSNNGQFTANNTSVLFVSISFIVLIIISLAWLVFYYIQRCRYTNAKERLSRRLANAAKKAIAKIPQRSVKYGDKELDSEADQCAVCIEPYKVSDVIRVLPCKHVFHKSCVDPWLLDQRSCPMCKMDILRAFGMHLNGSQESVPQDAESGILSSSPVIEETEHLSNSEEQDAVGGVKIVLYQHPSVHYRDRGSGHYRDMEMSSEASLDMCSSPVAQCHVECTSQMVLENNANTEMESLMTDNEQSLARSVSLESIHTSDDECNEIRSLMTGLPTRGGNNASVASTGSKSLRKSSGGNNSRKSSISQGIMDSVEH